MTKQNIVATPAFVQTTPVINHKVEQVVRAIYFGFEPLEQGASMSLHTSVHLGSAITFFTADNYLTIGIADERGYRFRPESNSALIALGYHPTAVLAHLTKLRLDGEPVVSVQGDTLVALHSAVVQCARDIVFNWERLTVDGERVGTRCRYAVLN